jgi:hypothetical protein
MVNITAVYMLIILAFLAGFFVTLRAVKLD